MNQKLLSYDLITQKVILMDEEKKEEYMSNVLEELQYSIVNYATQKLSEQEIYLLNFPDSSILQEDKSVFYSTIHKLIEELKKSNDYSYIQNCTLKLKDAEKGQLDLNYSEICGFVNFIIYIIDNMPRKHRESKIHNFAFKGELPAMKFEIKNVKYTTIIEKLKSIKNLNICLSNKDCKEVMKEKVMVNIGVIALFCLFFKAFFINLLILNFDLNIYEINRFFNKDLIPYKMSIKRIVKIGNHYKNIFLGNLLLIKVMNKYEKLCKVCFKMYDSYQLELHNLMSNYFIKSNIQNNDKKNKDSKQNEIIDINNDDTINFATIYQNKFLFFQHVLPKLNREFYDFNIEFNSLDPLLFSYVNIILFQYASLANISISFFDFNQVSYRKILINSYYYNLYSDSKKNPLNTKYSPEKINIKYDSDYKIYYNFINKIKNKQNQELLLLREELILNELFPYFNYNLNILLVILESKIKLESKTVNSISLNFNSNNEGYKNFNSYDNYNTSFICFLYNLLSILEENKQKCILSGLDLQMDDIGEEKEFIIRNILKKVSPLRESKPFNLKELKLTHIYFNIPNISLLLPFENFPMEKLSELIIDNLSFNDLNNLVNALKADKTLFPKLINLEISLSLMEKDFKKNLEILLTECIPKNISTFKLKIPCYISYEDIIDILTWIKRNKNNRVTIFLKLSHNKISPSAGEANFVNLINEFKKNYKNELNKRNIITDFQCSDYRNVSLSMKILNDKDINYFLKFIYCFNKIYDKNTNLKSDNKNKKQKIFENIFYYMGKFRKANKEVRIEII